MRPDPEQRLRLVKWLFWVWVMPAAIASLVLYGVFRLTGWV